MRIELVEWRDITADMGSWTKAEAVSPVMSTVTSVGILITETPEFVVLGSDYSEDKHYNGLNYIPKMLITRREQLQPAEYRPFEQPSERKGSSKKRSRRSHPPESAPSQTDSHPNPG